MKVVNSFFTTQHLMSTIFRRWLDRNTVNNSMCILCTIRAQQIQWQQFLSFSQQIHGTCECHKEWRCHKFCDAITFACNDRARDCFFFVLCVSSTLLHAFHSALLFPCMYIFIGYSLNVFLHKISQMNCLQDAQKKRPFSRRQSSENREITLKMMSGSTEEKK